MIIQATGDATVADILRDWNTHTSKAITKKPEEEKPEGYEEVLARFAAAVKALKRITKDKVWQDGNQAKLLFNNKFIAEKPNYIHNNPVK